MSHPGIIRKYPAYLPVAENFIVTLLEGNTPLLKADNLKKELGLACDLYLKFEGLNPTGSFKDRGMTYAVSKALEEGRKAIICASTGNTSAAAAAYAAKAGMHCTVLIPEGQIAYGKLSQAMIHGAKVVQIRGNFDAALKMVVEIGKKFPIQIVNSINPYRLMGQKTAAYEVGEVLGRLPDYHFIPVGNAGNITAYWRGYTDWHEEGKSTARPKMMGFQAAGAAPIVDGKAVKSPKTIASAIRIGNPASWQGALKAAKESGGVIDKVSDAEIVKAYQLIARHEGYFCEPASAASVAGVIKHKKKLKEGDLVVCTLTGHGLKDPDTAIKKSLKPVLCDAKFDKIVKVLKL